LRRCEPTSGTSNDGFGRITYRVIGSVHAHSVAAIPARHSNEDKNALYKLIDSGLL